MGRIEGRKHVPLLSTLFLDVKSDMSVEYILIPIIASYIYYTVPTKRHTYLPICLRKMVKISEKKNHY